MLPAELMIPPELKFDYMINFLAGEFGIPPYEAANCSEYDFWLRFGFGQMEQLKLKHITEHEQV